MARMQGLALPSGNRGLLIIAALAGLAAAVLFVVAVNNNDSKTSTVSPTGTGNTVVATKTIPSGAVIQADMVAATKIEDKLLIANPFSDAGQVVGQRAKYDIYANDQINASKVGPVPNGGAGISSLPAPGMRAVSLKVDQNTAVGGLLTPGDRVDIIASFKIKDRPLPDGQYILRTKTMLQNVEVLSVGQEHLEPLGARDSASDSSCGASGAVPSDVKEQPSASTITLCLNPDEALVVSSIQQTAKSVWTSLRPVGDADPIDPNKFYEEIVYE
jgi:Flp pilus assembly protein CpaB